MKRVSAIKLLSCLLFVIIAAQVCTVFAEPSQPFVIINHRFVRHDEKKNYFNYLPKGTIPRSGNWKGLFCKGSDCEVADVVVNVTIKPADACGAEGSGDPADFISVSGNPVAVFNGVPLKSGKVKTQLRATKEMFESSHFLKLRKLGMWQIASGNKFLSLSWTKLSLEDQYRYHLSDGKTKQFIFSSVFDNITPFVHWAGDLDGDGKTDLLMEIPYSVSDQINYYCQISERLYLSSQAQDVEILHKAAQVSVVIPSCGC